jgi:PAS domain S-box-containing protein
LTEAELSVLLEFSQDISAVLDDEGTIRYVSPAVTPVLGYEQDELVGKSAFDLMHPEDREAVWTRFADLVDAPGTETERVTHRQRHADGHWVWMESVGTNQTDTALDGYVFTSRDVSKRRAKEQELEDYRAYTEAIFDSLEDSFFVLDTEANPLRWNRVMTEATGYSDAEVAARNATDFVPPDQVDRVERNLRKVLETGRARFEADLVAKDGESTPYEFISSRLEDPDGTTVIAGIGRDVSERKARERRLRTYERAINGANDLIAAVDTDRRYLFANPAYREFYGLGESEIVGKRVADVLSGPTRDEIRHHLQRALEGESVRYQMTRSRPDSPPRTFDIRYFPLEAPDGELQGVVGTMRDLTEEKERERHITALDRMLRHNLRNDLNVVLGYAEMIRDDAGDVGHAVDQIERAATRLIEQAEKEREIVDVLSTPSAPEPLDLAGILDRTVSSMAAAHTNADFRVRGDAEVAIEAIPEVEVAVREVVENAVVHARTAAPTVTVTVEATDEWVDVSVADEGPGIPVQEQRIVTGESESDPLVHSSGMGLWLVDSIVTRSGGRIRFEDTDAGGTRVVMRLPRA